MKKLIAYLRITAIFSLLIFVVILLIAAINSGAGYLSVDNPFPGTQFEPFLVGVSIIALSCFVLIMLLHGYSHFTRSVKNEDTKT